MQNITRTLKSAEDPGTITSFHEFENLKFGSQENRRVENENENEEEEEEKRRGSTFVSSLFYMRILCFRVTSTDETMSNLDKYFDWNTFDALVIFQLIREY